MVTTVSVEEYRKVLNDYASSEEQIKKRLQYLEAFCRNIINNEVENYVKKVKQDEKRK